VHSRRGFHRLANDEYYEEEYAHSFSKHSDFVKEYHDRDDDDDDSDFERAPSRNGSNYKQQTGQKLLMKEYRDEETSDEEEHFSVVR